MGIHIQYSNQGSGHLRGKKAEIFINLKNRLMNHNFNFIDIWHGAS